MVQAWTADQHLFREHASSPHWLAWHGRLSTVLLVLLLLLSPEGKDVFASTGSAIAHSRKQHSKRTALKLRRVWEWDPRPRKIWLYLGIGAHFEGASVQLQHYLHHYLDILGYQPDTFLVVVNINATEATAKQEYSGVCNVLASWKLKYVLWKGEFTSRQHIKFKYTLFEAHGVEPQDWIAITDLDELHQLPVTPVSAYVDQLEAAGVNWVQGYMVDRVTSNGSLPHLAQSPSIYKQFPLACSIIKQLTGGKVTKIVLAKAYLRGDTGNHAIKPLEYYKELGDLWRITPYAKFPDCYTPLPEPALRKTAKRHAACKAEVWAPREAPHELVVYHFKWHSGVLASAARRARVYTQHKVRWAGESTAILDHLHTHDMALNVTQFGCAPPPPPQGQALIDGLAVLTPTPLPRQR